MEFLRVSKFKNQLRALITEARDLREREHCATEQIHLLIQKQKQTEEESDKKFQELQAELALSDELRQKLERKVKYLENDNALLENKQKELKGTIDCLLQSRENFVSLYEDSTCEMKRSIEIKDRKLAVLSEKIHNHLLLFESIEKEAVSVKQVVDNVQQLVNEKEETYNCRDYYGNCCISSLTLPIYPVSGLKRKMEKVSTFEKEYVEKICFLENKLKNNQDELQRRDTVISDLEGQLEAAKISNNSQPRIEEISIQLLMRMY
ncbi:hypothetical protein HHK36_015240 [Tetracentron sinense]|uniref:Uncharacterized protein n=1 Tax=Tetracentron sinense TaxID=13715 RepID=A0A834Z4S7_TETSI|nr:hypothetical protein HHK36_015240 [Tetracentron sinense]